MKPILKTLSLILASASVALAASAEDIPIAEVADLALKDVIHEAEAAFATMPIPKGAPVAVLPITGESDIPAAAHLMVKSALSAAGITCVEGKEDQALAEIVKEIAWDERKEDILDAATVDRFGRLQSAKFLVYGWVRRVIARNRSVVVELELHATEIATKRHVWGRIFTRRHTVPTADPKGRIDVPADVREMMRGKFRDDLAASLKKNARLSAVKSVACLPIAADIDQYAYGLVRDVLTASAIMPKNLDIATRAEARFALREGPGKGEAILYGAVRDVSADLKSVDFLQRKTYLANMEIQLWIEKGATREILWSDTLAVEREFTLGPRGWWDVVVAWFPSLEGRQGLFVFLTLAALVIVIFGLVVLHKATRVR